MVGENGIYLLSMKETKFKHTEIGLIPEDWEVKAIGDIARIVGGGTPSTEVSLYWNGNIQWFTPAEITNAPKYVSRSERTISELGKKNCSAKLLPPGTILLTTRASIGATAILLNEACTNQGFQSLIVTKDTSNEFIYYQLPLVKNEMLKQASGSTFPELSAKKLAKIGIALPSTLAEQERIAEALSSIDTLIRNLDRTIEKKKNIRQGAMEQLLSGKKRLPGFKGEWEEESFDDIFGTIPTRGKAIDASLYQKTGKYPIVDQGQEKVVGYTDAKNPIRVKDGGYLVFGDHTRIFKFIQQDFYVGADGTKVLTCRDIADPQFMYYKCLCLDIPNTGYNRHFVYLKEASFVIPTDIKEQTAIADLHTAMDDEIAVLQMERDKYANIRSGMMDDLLTGAKRI